MTATGPAGLRRAQPTAAALRQARRRERRARGCRVVPVELSQEILAELARRGLVAPYEVDDPAALAFALGAAIEELLCL